MVVAKRIWNVLALDLDMQRVQRVEVKLVTVGKRPTVGTGKVELLSQKCTISLCGAFDGVLYHLDPEFGEPDRLLHCHNRGVGVGMIQQLQTIYRRKIMWN